jgi:hypothetical protein
VSGDGTTVYVAGAGDEALAVFSRDVGTGALEFVDAVASGDCGMLLPGAPVSVIASRGGRDVYAAGSDYVAAFAPEPDTAALGLVACGALAALCRRRVTPP